MQPQDNRREHHGVHSGHKGPPPRPVHSRPSGQWRKEYDCKVNKGDHTFILTKPHWNYRKEQNVLGIEEYYDEVEAEHKECLEKRKKDDGLRLSCWRVLYHFKCTACGKQKMSSERKI